MREILQSSDKLKQPPAKAEKHDFPWNAIDCGQSFSVLLSEIKFNSLRALASKRGKKLSKKFRVIQHESCYEVGRIK